MSTKICVVDPELLFEKLEEMMQKINEIEEKIGSQTPVVEEMMTVREAAKYLNISEAYLNKQRGLADSKGPRFVRQGGFIRYKKSELDKWRDGGQSGGFSSAATNRLKRIRGQAV